MIGSSRYDARAAAGRISCWFRNCSQRVVRVGRAAYAVARLDIEPDAVALGEHHATSARSRRRPGPARPALSHCALGVRVIRPVRQRQRGHRACDAKRAASPWRPGPAGSAGRFRIRPAVGCDVADGREDVHVLGAARDPQHQHRPGRSPRCLASSGAVSNDTPIARQTAGQRRRGPRRRGDAGLGHAAGRSTKASCACAARR